MTLHGCYNYYNYCCMGITESKTKQTPAKLCVHFSGWQIALNWPNRMGAFWHALKAAEDQVKLKLKHMRISSGILRDSTYIVCALRLCDTSNLLGLPPTFPYVSLCYFCPIPVHKQSVSPPTCNARVVHTYA